MNRVHHNAKPLGSTERAACNQLYEILAFDDDRAFVRWLEEPEHVALLIQISTEFNPPLEAAVEMGSLAILQAWAKWGMDPAGWTGASRQTLLHLAAASTAETALEIAQWLVEDKGVSPLTPDARGKTPLHVALEKGSPAMAGWMVAQMAAAGQLVGCLHQPRPFQDSGAILETLARLGVVIGRPVLARSIDQHQKEGVPSLRPPEDLLAYALTELPEPLRQTTADLLVANGVPVSSGLAFQLWDTAQTYSRNARDWFRAEEILWALSKGAHHQSGDRNMIDEVTTIAAQEGGPPSLFLLVQGLFSEGCEFKAVPPVLRFLEIALHPFCSEQRWQNGWAKLWDRCVQPVPSMAQNAPPCLSLVLKHPPKGKAMWETIFSRLSVEERKTLRQWVSLAASTFTRETLPAPPRLRM